MTKSKDEAIQFLSEFIDRINTQDNRATATPYFYIVRKPLWRPTHSDYASGDTREVHVDWTGDPTVHHEYDDYLQEVLMEHGYASDEGVEDDEIEEWRGEREKIVTKAKKSWDEMEVVHEELIYEEDNIFFTEHGYNQHMELNGHNYNRKCQHGKENAHSYVKHAFRNPEIQDLLSSVAVLVGKELIRK